MHVPLQTVSIQQTLSGPASSRPGPGAGDVEMGDNTLHLESSVPWRKTDISAEYDRESRGFPWGPEERYATCSEKERMLP